MWQTKMKLQQQKKKKKKSVYTSIFSFISLKTIQKKKLMYFLTHCFLYNGHVMPHCIL